MTTGAALTPKGKVTISTHGGHTVATGHNLRVPEIVLHEPHIDPDGVHEVWQHEHPRAFYERTFEPAREEYNRTARKSRRIVKAYYDYLNDEAERLDAENEQIRAANAEAREWNELHEDEIKAGTAEKLPLQKEKVVKRAVYEEIIGVYAQDELELEDEECRELLWQHVMGDGTPEHPSWQERHPGFRVVGIYYHADEPDGDGPHVHLDYVPVAEFDRGMAVQNSVEAALAREGLKSGKVLCIDGKEHLKTARELWSAAENEHLQQLCEEAGFEVIHPQRGAKSVHLSTAEKKLMSQLDAEAERQAAVAARQEAKQRSLDSQQRGLNDRAALLAKERRELDDRAAELDRREDALTKAEARTEAAQNKAETVTKAANKAIADVKQLRLTVAERQQVDSISAALEAAGRVGGPSGPEHGGPSFV